MLFPDGVPTTTLLYASCLSSFWFMTIVWSNGFRLLSTFCIIRLVSCGTFFSILVPTGSTGVTMSFLITFIGIPITPLFVILISPCSNSSSVIPPLEFLLAPFFVTGDTFCFPLTLPLGLSLFISTDNVCSSRAMSSNAFNLSISFMR
uniref:Uncharacterized protein n=1 Tax=Cacopsylla melanoneura TaxID=428564 RepID=A0A8D8YFY4_9HEMI